MTIYMSREGHMMCMPTVRAGIDMCSGTTMPTGTCFVDHARSMK